MCEALIGWRDAVQEVAPGSRTALSASNPAVSMELFWLRVSYFMEKRICVWSDNIYEPL